MTDRDTITRLELKVLQPYVGLVRDACAKTDGLVDPYDFAALGFRESGWGWTLDPKGDPFGLGDSGHGFGLFQIDDRYNRLRISRVKIVRASRGDQAALEAMADEAIAVLLEGRTYLASPNRPQPLTGEALRRAMFAAYNAGEGRVYHSVVDQGLDHVDEHTAGGDYSAWIVAKSAALRVAAPDLFGGAQ